MRRSIELKKRRGRLNNLYLRVSVHKTTSYIYKSIYSVSDFVQVFVLVQAQSLLNKQPTP